jgi:SNF2 family DNA or RNA helicase
VSQSTEHKINTENLNSEIFNDENFIDEDKGGATGERQERKTWRSLRDQYETIRDLLGIVEASTLEVGVPFLFPTKRILKRKKIYQKPLDEFIRFSLVTAHTRTLILYRDELNDLTTGSELFPSISKVERYGIMLTITAIVYLILTRTLLIWFQSVLLLSLAYLISGIILGVIVLSAGDVYRRTTFANLLSREIQRRKGTGNNNKGNKLEVCMT